MQVDLFDFELPDELIARHPARPRDAARLLDLTGPGWADRQISDLPQLLRPGDVLVANDTRVIPARLRGRRGTAGVEVTLLKPITATTWQALARPAKRLRVGDRVDFAPGFAASVTARPPDSGEVILDFDLAGPAFRAALEQHGAVPLPPYIKRRPEDPQDDRADYQTVYAREDGAVAAPTAGLHFTPDLLAAVAARGVQFVTVTLHVGAGTFLPVKVADTRDHRMHLERGRLGAATAAAIQAARAAGGRVVAVGTTSLRVLETSADDQGRLAAFDGETDLFITPGYRFKMVDLLLTNFHLPRSTLFMLVCALAGRERMQAAYAHARQQGYRFYSYGDACLLARSDP